MWRFIAVLVSVLYACSAGAFLPSADADLLAAQDAYRARDRAKLDLLLSRLAGQLLEPYAVYWNISLAIDEDIEDPVAVRLFLTRYADTPLAEPLRERWLKALGRRNAWTIFGTEYPRAHSEDNELLCYGLQYRGQLDAAALNDARPLWLSAQESPASCTPVFNELFSRGWLRTEDIWQRFRLASEAANTVLASQVNNMLPDSERIPATQFELATRDPQRWLEHAPETPSNRAERELFLYALIRVAHNTPLVSREYLIAHREHMPPDDLNYAKAQLAFFGARKLAPEALVWYQELGEVPLSDAQLAWEARAGLRGHAWPVVLSAIDRMSSAYQQDPAWRYWKARAWSALGREREAKSLLVLLAQESNYYGLLAAEDLGRPVAMTVGSAKPDAAAEHSFERTPAIQRALKLFELDLRVDAIHEWAWATRNLDDDQLLLAAEVARRNLLYDRAMFTADKTVLLHDYRLRYLAPYEDTFATAARSNGVDEALILGLVRQESRFIAESVSSAGAVGLMQIMPPTAKWVAKKLGLGRYRGSSLAMIKVNVELGTFYFRHVLDRLNGLPALAAAAYNAGPGRAQAWRGAEPLEGAIYVETIPIAETRDYVKKVLANAVFYARLLGHPGTSLKQRLGIVPPRNTEAKTEDIAMQEKELAK